MAESDKVEVKGGLLRSLDNPTKWPIKVSHVAANAKGMFLVGIKSSKLLGTVKIRFPE